MDSSNNTRTINYTNIDFDSLRTELINYLKETDTFKDLDIESSNIRTFVDVIAYVGQLFGYYIYGAANEVFLPTARKYGNLIKIAELLRYEARGVTSAKVAALGQLLPEYVYSKEGQQIEIPAYSIFPSTRATTNGENFQFTNVEPVNYILKGYGTRVLASSDISYKGYALPFTAPASFFSSGNTVVVESSGFSLPLSKLKQLRIIKRNDVTNYRPYDTTNYPLKQSTGSYDQGQPFESIVESQNNGSLIPNTLYYLVFNYNKTTYDAYLTVINDLSLISNREDDLICSFMLSPTDNTNTYYEMKVVDLHTHNRFYVGTLGMQNLESVTIKLDALPNRPQSLEKISLIINEDGTKPPFGVLINGKYYTFSNGIIESQKLKQDYFDTSVAEYNVNLIISEPEKSEINYGATLDITASKPLENQATIAKIYTNMVGEDGQPSIITYNLGRFGDIRLESSIQTKTSNQRAGIVTFNAGDENTKVLFNKPLATSNYQISISSATNVRKWYGNQNINGFTIYIEPDSNFSGDISWVASETIEDNVRETQVYFDTPLSQVLENNTLTSNYMVSLTPSQNIEVWYENLTSNGFTMKTSRNYTGNVSWSVYNYFEDGFVPTENISNSYMQTGKVVLNPIVALSMDVTLEIPINDPSYSIQITPDTDAIVWYTNKTSNGFTINIEDVGINKDIVINWKVDSSLTEYQYQKHGETQFRGTDTVNNSIAGLVFLNIPESFLIENLYEGRPQVSHINTNLVIDSLTNKLNLALDSSRLSESDAKFIISNKKISSNTIRVFVKNSEGKWDEWERAGFVYNKTLNVNEKIYKISMHQSGKLTLEFGNGENWGTSVEDKEILIIALESVGKEGNITKNTIAPNVILSQYILGNDITSVEFENNLVSLIGLKSELYFEGKNVSTQIIDSENTKLNFTDLTISQNKNAFGGNDTETVNELRQNANNFFVTQNRLVSLDDYSRYITQAFYDYLIKTKVLSFKEAKEKGLIPESEPANYWFNYVFIIGLNKDGSNLISQNLRAFLISQLDKSEFRMIGVDHEIISANWVPIDVVIRYKKTKGGSAQVIESQIKKNLELYFSDDSLHELGETIYHSKIASLIDVDNVETFEVMLNKNATNKIQASDYNVNFRTTDKDVNIARRNRLMELVAKDPSLVKIYQPLFDTLNVDGTREWNYSLDIKLEEFEYPKLGNVVIERQG
jgi:hypothetical protein